MIVTHNLGKDAVRKNVEDNPEFLLANKNGGFAYLASGQNTSKFQGVYFSKDWNLYKTIENIRLSGVETEELRNNFFNVERVSSNCIERFFTNHTDTLLYEALNHHGFIDLVLDCREIYDFDIRGRIYKIDKNDDLIVIEYTKFKDDSLQKPDYKIYIAIKGAREYVKNDSWEPRTYEADKKRNSGPFELFVYNALKIKCDGNIKLAISYSMDRNEAIRTAKHASDNFNFLKKSKEKYVNSLINSNLKTTNKEIILAYKNCLNAMDSFLVKGSGLYAGFPWFTQIWTRDEAKSIGALFIEERFAEVKKILFRQIKSVMPDGRIPNRFPHSELGSADGVGWVWKRVFDFILELQVKGKLNEFLSKEELVKIQEQLGKSIQGLLKYHTKEGLAENSALETWMDTGYKDDLRAGFRIEIQVLRLSMYRLMAYLCDLTKNNTKYMIYDELLHLATKEIKERFWKKPILSDGDKDPTIRPNIYMAYYIYPDLLTKREWIACFDKANEALFLDWGGLATIDKNHKYFVAQYTGQNNRSYHRGDSWFFINNMAALCMYKLEKNRYRKEINKIIEASTKDILYKGIAGFHSELSSAEEQRAEASLAQCWSSAFYIELINKIF